MSDQIFSKSWAAVWQHILRQAADEVRKLPREGFSDPALAGKLEGIAKKYAVEIAELKRSEISADSRTEERRGDDYGRSYMRQVKWLDISVPLSGDPETLHFHPSSWSMPNQRASVSVVTWCFR